MAEVVLGAVSTVAGCLVAPVDRLCGYVISYDSHVRELDVEVAKLRNALRDVHHFINDAEYNVKPIDAYVRAWVEHAERHTKEARHFLVDYRRAEITCFYGWLPNPMVRYRLGREARRKAKYALALICQMPSRVVYDDRPPGLVDGASHVISSADDQGDTIFESRASILENIINALDDEKHKVIGIYGQGGVGKTTLLLKVEDKLRKEKRLFHMIAITKVSQTPDLKKIQEDIAYAFRLNLKDEPSEAGRRDLLFKRLRKDPSEKVLIILDDLWEELDLREVGIPSADESRGCKLLLTSRYKHVLVRMKCDAPIFPLEGLKDDEPFRLFDKWVGNRLNDEEELRAIALQVVQKLAGLPLLIISVACTLKHSDVSAWRNALKKIDEKKIKTIIKLSYDQLESEDTRSLFLLCGLIGGTIQVELLLGLGMGLGLFEGFNYTIEDSRDELNSMLDSLRSICLLQDGGDHKKSVTIHDLYSEVIVSAPFGGQNSLMMNSNYGSWSKEQRKKYWAMHLVNVGIDKFAELKQCGFPNLKVLMLSQPEKWDGKPAHRHDGGDCCRLDFTYMNKLRVLYLCSMHIATLPSSIGILKNLRSLYLVHCEVDGVVILSKLKALQILSFAGSAISRLPKEMGELTDLRLLDLSNCEKLQRIECGVLERLINLEELRMKNGFDQWEELRMKNGFDQWVGEDEIRLESCNAKLSELKSMTKLTSLEISIGDPIILSECDDLPYKNLTRFWINIGNVGRSEFEGLTTMKLQLIDRVGILLNEWVQEILYKTQYLNLEGLTEFYNAHDLFIREVPRWKHLSIHRSPSIKYVAGHLHLIRFRTLESLYLGDLNNLEKICDGPIAEECFGKLKVVNVINCDQLRYLWCFSKKRGLVHLEEIEIRSCLSMQTIVIDDAREDEVVANEKVELPSVRCLELMDLPNMTGFCRRTEITSEDALIQVILPSLEKLTLHGVGSLTLGKCSEGFNVFSLTIIERLYNLKEVIILNCDFMESLFDCGSFDANTEQKTVLLLKLERVEVYGAKRLRHMVKSHSPTGLGFPNLEIVSVENCSNLRYLFPNFTATTLGKLKSLQIGNCKQMKEVSIKEDGDQSKAEVMSFHSLKFLRISQCPKFEVFIRSPISVERQLGGEIVEENDESPQPLFNEMVTFPNITCLRIEGLQCKELWNDQIPTDSFQNLESLELKSCDNLQRVAPFYMWKRLQPYLEILEVISCCSIEIIYEGDGTDTESGKLRRLVLRDLMNLRCIWQSNSFPNIPFPNLRDVEAVRCPCLEMLFPTFTAKLFGQIEELVVESCENMELIAGHEKGEEGSSTTITFSKLILLRFFELPKFRSFFLCEKYSLKFSCSEDFPSLRYLSIVSCEAEPDQVIGDWWDHRCEGQMRRFPGQELSALGSELIEGTLG